MKTTYYKDFTNVKCPFCNKIVLCTSEEALSHPNPLRPCNHLSFACGPILGYMYIDPTLEGFKEIEMTDKDFRLMESFEMYKVNKYVCNSCPEDKMYFVFENK